MCFMEIDLDLASTGRISEMALFSLILASPALGTKVGRTMIVGREQSATVNYVWAPGQDPRNIRS